ncbi:hypothetical protein RIF29_14487 [Crotalaria pallida]|uniref:Uncharacterized protein n=1 Tax=Crotalaria pallida TaxID=3830 RepID=A0AAN9FK64_CROPI
MFRHHLRYTHAPAPITLAPKITPITIPAFFVAFNFIEDLSKTSFSLVTLTPSKSASPAVAGDGKEGEVSGKGVGGESSEVGVGDGDGGGSGGEGGRLRVDNDLPFVTYYLATTLAIIPDLKPPSLCTLVRLHH